MHAILILVTDGAHARILQRDSKKDNVYQIQNLTGDHESTQEHGRDRPGRVFASSKTMKLTYDPKTDWHTHQKDLFIQNVAKELTDLLDKTKYYELYLICAPKSLGMLRSSINPYLNSNPSHKDLVVREINKDLTHATIEEIEKCINNHSPTS